MNDKGKKPGPKVEVVVRKVNPEAVVPAVIVPMKRAPGVVPRPKVEVVPVKPGVRPEVRPGVATVAPVTARGSSPRPPFRSADRKPVGPVTPEMIAELARRERVPARIAKGELDGKMKCRIWKKLHAEEAKRFDEAYILMGQHPGLELADAFGIVQSGMPVDAFLAKRARAKKKGDVKVARTAVPGEAVDAFIASLVTDKVELSLVLAESTVRDTITEVKPVSFVLERTGLLPKLNVVAIARKGTWDTLLPTLERDSKLTARPAGVARQPSRRPVTDPRPFLELVGRTLKIQTRNGLIFVLPLIASGPFDVLLGTAGNEVLVPLHAMMSWTAA